MGTVTRRAGVSLVVPIAVLAVSAAPAEATFPGANGKIAFWNISGFVTQIQTIRPDGTHRNTLTSIERHNFAPTWSADGSRIAFVSERDRRARLVTMNADGTDLTSALTAPTITSPSWSPNSDRIAFSGLIERGAPWRTFVLDLGDGQVSAVCRQCFSPDWSRTGQGSSFAAAEADSGS
jgi:Tol biopolymer transport system component